MSQAGRVERDRRGDVTGWQSRDVTGWQSREGQEGICHRLAESRGTGGEMSRAGRVEGDRRGDVTGWHKYHAKIHKILTPSNMQESRKLIQDNHLCKNFADACVVRDVRIL